MENKQQSLMVSISVVVAAVIVVIGIVLTSDGSGGSAPSIIGNEALASVAEEYELDTAELNTCLESGEVAEIVDGDVAEARAAGGSGTPFSVFILDDPLSPTTHQAFQDMFASNPDVYSLGQDATRFSVSGALPAPMMEQMLAVLAEDPSGTAAEGTANLAIPEVTADDHVRGPLDAPVKVVEYSDIDCPFCARFHETMVTVHENNPQQVAWVYRHFPLTSLHPEARGKAITTECVAEQDEEAFWSLLDEYYLES